MKSKWLTIISVIAVLGLFSMLFAWVLEGLYLRGSGFWQGNVAVIPIKGEILSEEGEGFLSPAQASASVVIEFLEKAEGDQSVKAIILDINSPGGTPVATDEIARAVKKSNKTTVAVIHDIGASGAYWIASATDAVFANPMSIVGSIGAVSSYIDFSGLMERYGVSYNRLVSGEFKDAGSPFKNLTARERLLLQSKLDKIHQMFIEEVARNRNLGEDEVKALADGSFLLGIEARDAGLVDFLGSREDAVAYLEKRLNISASLVEYRRKQSFFGMLSQLMGEQSFRVGQGVGNALLRSAPDIRT